jgi:hypothetical protein
MSFGEDITRGADAPGGRTTVLSSQLMDAAAYEAICARPFALARARHAL